MSRLLLSVICVCFHLCVSDVPILVQTNSKNILIVKFGFNSTEKPSKDFIKIIANNLQKKHSRLLFISLVMFEKIRIMSIASAQNL